MTSLKSDTVPAPQESTDVENGTAVQSMSPSILSKEENEAGVRDVDGENIMEDFALDDPRILTRGQHGNGFFILLAQHQATLQCTYIKSPTNFNPNRYHRILGNAIYVPSAGFIAAKYNIDTTLSVLPITLYSLGKRLDIAVIFTEVS